MRLFFINNRIFFLTGCYMNPSLKLITELLLDVAYRLCICSAETRLIVQTTERIAKAFGYVDVDVIVHDNGEQYSLLKKVEHIGINMHNLTTITHLCLKIEHGELPIEEALKSLKKIKTYAYNPYLMCFVIGFATFAFAFLNGGSIDASYVGFCTGFLTMAVRLFLQSKKLFPLFVFTMGGFVATLFAYLFGKYVFMVSEEDLKVSMVVSVLLLVPGFPFMNGILDVFKGYSNMGISRLITTFVLLACVCVGITMAMEILPGKGW